ncbi:hypothetical protein Tco_0957437 [Tanacetum coccineum]
MSLDNSNDYNIPNTDPVDPALEDVVLPKFDIHLYQSSLTKTHVTWLVKCYRISEDLHPRVVPVGMIMDQLPNDAMRIYAHHFQQGGLRVPFSIFSLRVVEYFCVHISQLGPIGINRTTIFEMYCRALDIRAAPIAMAWRHHDSSVAGPFPKPTEYNEQDATKLQEVVITLHKPDPSLLYVAGLSRIWKNDGRVQILKGPEGKVLTMADLGNSPDSPNQPTGGYSSQDWDVEVAELACRRMLADKEKKKRKAETKGAAKADDDAHTERVVSKKHADLLRNQTGEQESPRPNVVTENVEEPTTDGRVSHKLGDADLIKEGHGDNANGLFGLHLLTDSVKKPMCDKVVVDTEASYSVGQFGNLPFTPQWGLTESSRMYNSRNCRDMMSNLFTPTDFEALSEEHADLVYAHESCKDTKAHCKEYNKEMAK